MASVSLLKNQHVFLSHAPRGLISALYLVQQCHCEQQLSSTALKAGGSSTAAEQRMLKQQGCSTGCWATACGSADTALAQWPELSHQDWQNKPGEVFTAEQDVKWRSCAPVVMPPRARGGEATSAFSWVRAARKAQLLSLLHSQPVAEVQNVLV